MAALQGDNYAKTKAVPSANKLGANEWEGKVRTQKDEITLAAPGIGSTVAIATVPLNSAIVDVKIFNAALGATVTIDVGDSETAGRYMTAQDGNAAGEKRLSVLGGFNHVIATQAQREIFVTLGVADPTGVMKSEITYSAE